MRLKKNGLLLAEELIKALNSLGGWGSLEIFVQDHKVTQITRRAINKTNHELQEPKTGIQKNEGVPSSNKRRTPLAV